jgi:hypothetical protein
MRFPAFFFTKQKFQSKIDNFEIGVVILLVVQQLIIIHNGYVRSMKEEGRYVLWMSVS